MALCDDSAAVAYTGENGALHKPHKFFEDDSKRNKDSRRIGVPCGAVNGLATLSQCLSA